MESSLEILKNGSHRTTPENGSEENGVSTLVAERKPEGLLLSRLSEKNGDGNAHLMPVADSSSVASRSTNGAPTLKGVMFLTKIQQQLEAEAARNDEEAPISAQELSATIDALRGCLEALEKIEGRALRAGEKQAQWLRDELRAMESLLSVE